MHHAALFVRTLYPTAVLKGPAAAPPPLSAANANTLSSYLAQDAISYAYSGAITLSESISSASRDYYTWSTVKAYYATFYFVRAILAFNGTGIFYDGKTPWNITSVAGQVPEKGKGTTHQFAMTLFRKKLASNWLLSQLIGLDDPLEWLQERREDANYKLARFVEPAIPAYFVKISTAGVRKSITLYLQTGNEFLAFDADHAILAYPLQALIHCVAAAKHRAAITTAASPFSNADLKFLSSICKDKAGLIPEFPRLLKY